MSWASRSTLSKRFWPSEEVLEVETGRLSNSKSGPLSTNLNGSFKLQSNTVSALNHKRRKQQFGLTLVPQSLSIPPRTDTLFCTMPKAGEHLHISDSAKTRKQQQQRRSFGNKRLKLKLTKID